MAAMCGAGDPPLNSRPTLIDIQPQQFAAIFVPTWVADPVAENQSYVKDGGNQKLKLVLADVPVIPGLHSNGRAIHPREQH
jgi:hypothetical protein